MGTWSSSIFGNDLSCDVRDTYMEYLYAGLSDEEALKQTLLEYAEEIEDEDAAPNVWLALAGTTWKLGRMTDEVKDQALACICVNTPESGYKQTKDRGTARMRALMTFKEVLESPMPDRKKVVNPYPEITNPWNIGDYYAYCFHKKCSIQRGLQGKYIVVQKIADCDIWGKVSTVIRVFNRVFDTLPQIDDIRDAGILPLFEKGTLTQSERYLSSGLFYHKKNDYQSKWFTFLGHEQTSEISSHEASAPHRYEHQLNWHDFDDALSLFYVSWEK